MGLNFPDAPTVGPPATTFTAPNGSVWVWDGVKWGPAATSSQGFLALSGGTMQGDLILNRDPLLALGAATKEYVDVSAPANMGGFVNRLRNGTFDVWQRGLVTVAAATNGYTADGWVVAPVGAGVTVQRTPLGSNPPYGASVMNITGAAGLTSLAVFQRIESYVSGPLANQRVTFQCWAYSPIAETPTLAVVFANAVDNFTATTPILSATPLQPLPAAAWTKLAYTFDVPSGAFNGLHVQLGFPGALGAGTMYLAAADLRATPGLPVGLCANPPPPELRPIGVELPFCQRYLMRWNGAMFIGLGIFSSATAGVAPAYYPVFMRAFPTVTAATAGGFSFGANPGTFTTTGSTGQYGVTLNITGTGAASLPASLAVNAGNYLQASAEL